MPPSQQNPRLPRPPDKRLCCFLVITLMLLTRCTGAPGIHQAAPRRHSSDRHQFLYILAGQEVFAYRINDNGTLQKVPFNSPYLGRHPSFLAQAPGGAALYAGGIEDEYKTPSGYISRFSVSRNAALNEQKGAPAGADPSEIALGNSGQSIYILSDGFLLSLRVSPAGTYTRAMTPIMVGSSASLAASRNGRFLWVSRWQEKSVTAYQITSTGTIKPVMDLRLSKRPGRTVWHPNDKSVYIAHPDDGTVTEITVRGKKPVLLTSSKITRGPTNLYLSVHPSGRCLFVCDAARKRVGVISLLPDGHLTGDVRWYSCLYPYAMILTQDGRFAYTLDPKDNLVGQFMVKNGSRLSPLKPSSVRTADYPLSFDICGAK